MEIVSNRTDCKILSDERAEFDCHQVPHICIIASIFCGKTDGIRQQSWIFWKEKNQPSQFLFQNPSDFLYCQCDKRDFIGMTLHWIGQLSSCLHLWALEWVNNWLHYIANFCGHLKALISNPKYSWNAQEDNEISGTQASKKCTLTIQPFKNHYQESAVNTNCPVGMYALMHPWEWINDERRSSNKSLGSAHIWYFFWCAVQGTHHWTIFRKIR